MRADGLKPARPGAAPARPSGLRGPWLAAALLAAAFVLLTGAGALAQNPPPIDKDADLLSLRVSEHLSADGPYRRDIFDENVSRGTTSFTVYAGRTSTHVKVSPVSRQIGSTVTVGKRGGTPEELGRDGTSSAIALDGDETVLTVVVTARDRTTTRTYPLTVKRDKVVVLGYDVNPTRHYTQATVEGAGKVRVPLTVSALPQSPLSVSVQASDITAVAGADHDFTAARTVTFRPSDTTRTRFLEFSVIDDTAVDFTETFRLDLFQSVEQLQENDAYRYHPVGSRAHITILDNDGAASLSGKTYGITPTVSVKEGARAVLDITLGEAAPAGGLAFSVTPRFRTGAENIDTSATAVDLGPVPSTITVPAGGTRARLSIPIANDDLEEPDEDFSVGIATTAAGWSAASGGDSARVLILGSVQPVNAPANITATGDRNTISVRWTPRADARAYHVRYRVLGGSWKAWEWATDAFHAFGSLEAEVYEVQVRTVTGTGGQVRTGRWSEPVPVEVADPRAAALSAPANLSVEARSPYSLHVNWDALPGAAAYEVQYTRAALFSLANDAAEFSTSRAEAGTAWVRVPGGLTDTGLTIARLTDTNAAHRVRVRATKGDVKGAWAHDSHVPLPELRWVAGTGQMEFAVALTEDSTQGADCRSSCVKTQYRLSPSAAGAGAAFPETEFASPRYAPAGSGPASLADDLPSGHELPVVGTRGSHFTLAIAHPLDDGANEADETYTITIPDGARYFLGQPATAVVTIRDINPPAAPSGLALTSGDGRLTAAWSKPAGPVTAYGLRYKTSAAADRNAATPGDPATGWVEVPGSLAGRTAAVTGLSNGTAYDVQVRATDGQGSPGNGWGAWSPSRTVTPGALAADAEPAPVTGLAVTPGARKLDLAWTAPQGPVTGYDVDWTTSAAVAEDAAVQSGSAPSAADGWVDGGHAGRASTHSLSGLAAGALHRVRVRAVNANGGGPWVTGAGTPVDGRLVLKMFSSPAVTVEEGFGDFWSGTLEGGLPTRELRATATVTAGTAKAGTDYTFRHPSIVFTLVTGRLSEKTFQVQAVDDDVNEAEESFTVTVAPDAASAPYMRAGAPSTVTITIRDNDPPLAPSGLALTPGDRTMTARWTKPPGPVSGYRLRYRQSGLTGNALATPAFHEDRGAFEDPATGWVEKTVGGGTSTDLGSGFLTPGQTYEVQVQADDGQPGAGNGRGPWSATVTGAASGQPDAPSGLKVTGGYDRLDLAWEAPEVPVTGWEVHFTSAVVATQAPAGGTDPGSGWVAAPRSGPAAAQAITGLTNGRFYRVRVRGVNGIGKGAWTFGSGTPVDRRIVLSLDPDSTVEYLEGAASGVSLDAVLDRTAERDLRVVVSAGSGTATEDEDFSVDSGTVTFPVREDMAKVGLTLLEDTVNEAHETVTVAVRPDVSADSDLRQGEPSSLKVTLLDDDPPAAPTGFAVQPGFRRLTATWTKPAGPAARYQVRYKATFAPDSNASGNNPRSGWVTLSPTGTATSLAITESDGIERTQRTYDVQVRADDGQTGTGNGWGPWSANVKATPSTSQEGASFAAPTALAVTEGHAQLRLAWQAVPSFYVVTTEFAATGYDVHYTASATVASDQALSGNASTGWADAGHTGTGTAISITGLTNGQEYRMRIRATNAAEGLAGPWTTVTGTPTDPFLESLTLLSGGAAQSILSVSAFATPFAPKTLTYAASVPSLHDDAKVVAVPRDPTARIRAGESEASLAPLAGRAQSRVFDLDYGTGNAIVVEVTDGNGAKQVYTLNVTRLVDIGFVPGTDVTHAENAGALRLALGPRIARNTAGTLSYRAGAVHPVAFADDLGSSLPATFSTTADGSRLTTVEIPVTDDGVNEEHETFSAAIAIRPQDRHLSVHGDRGAITVTIMDDDPPAAPGDFEVARTGVRYVATWTKPAGPVTGYELRYEQTDDGATGPATTPGDPTTGWVTLSLPGTATSAVLTGLEPWRIANVELRATDGQAGPGNGWSDRSTDTFIAVGPPIAPGFLTAGGYTLGGVGVNGAIDVGWRGVGRETGYDVHYTASATVADDAAAGTDPAIGWVAVDRSGAGTREFERITGLVTGRAYRVRVRGVNELGPSDWGFARATAADQRPSVTFDAAARSVAEGGRVQATAQLVGVTGAITRELRARITAADGTATHGEDHNFGGVEVVFPLNGAKEQPFAFDLDQDTANEADETFTLTLVPTTAGGFLRAGTPSSMTVTITDDDPPAAPGAFKATPGDRSLTLSWTKPSGPVDTYQVSWKTADAADADAVTEGDPATGWVAMEVSGQATSTTVSGLVNGQEYSLRIRADDGQTGGSNGQGAAASATGTPVGAPGAPTGLTFASGYGRLDLSWTAPPGPVTGYDIHYTYSVSAGATAAAGSNALAGWVAVSRTESDPPATTQAVTGLLNQPVRVRLRAKNGNGAGPWAAGTGDPSDARTTIRFGIESAELGEGNAQDIGVIVTRSVAQTRNVSAVVAPAPGTAEAADYSVTPLSLPIVSGGSGNATIRATAVQDTENEAHETFTVTLAPGALSRDQLRQATDYHPVTVTILDDDPPAAPTGLTLKQQIARQFVAAWDKPPGPVAEYQLQYTARAPNQHSDGRTHASDPEQGWVTATSTGTGTSLASPRLPGRTVRPIYVRVRARDGQAAPGNGWSPWSGTVRIDLINANGTGDDFLAPTGLAVTPGDAQLRLAWSAVPDFFKIGPGDVAVTGYDVHYTASATVAADAALSGDAATGWVDAGHTGTGTAQTVTGLVNGREYRLRIRAVDANKGVIGPWATVTGSPVSGDNALSALRVEYMVRGQGASASFVNAPLSPAFAPDVTSYDVYVPQDANVRVLPTAQGNGADIRLDPLTGTTESVASGAASKDHAPRNTVSGSNPGDVPFTVEVAAANDPMRQSVRTYTLTLRLQPYLSFAGGDPAEMPLGEVTLAEGRDSSGGRFTLAAVERSITRDGVAVALDYAGSGSDPASPDDDLKDGYAASLRSSAGNALVMNYPGVEDDAVNEAHETFTITIRDSAEYIRRTPSSVTMKILDNDPPAAPGGLTLTQGTTDLTAAWEKPAGPVARYELRYKTADAPAAAATTPGDPATGWVTLALSGTVLSTKIAGLAPALDYDVQARADDGQTEAGNGWGDWSATVSTPLGPPAAVTGLRARTGNGHAQADRLDLSWIAPPGTVTGYDVHYTAAAASAVSDAVAVQAGTSPDPAAGWVAVMRSGTATVQAITGLSVGTRYRMRVRAGNGNGQGPWAFVAGAPADRRHVLRFDADAASVEVNETAATLELSAELDRRPFRALAATAEFTDGTAALDTDFTVAAPDFAFAPDAAVEPGGAVVSRIAVAPVDNAVNEEDRTFTVTLAPDAASAPDMRLGEPSTLTVTILDDDPPAAPGGFTATPGNGSLTLSWTKPTGPVSMYVLAYKTAGAPDVETDGNADPAAGWVFLDDVDGADTSVTVTGLANHVEYQARIHALDEQRGEGLGAGPVASATGTPAGPPAAPTGLAVTPGLYSLGLSWTAPVGPVTGYDVHYTTATAGNAADADAASGRNAASGWVAVDRGTESDPPAVRQTIGGLANGVAVRVRVRAKTGDGAGAWVFGTDAPADGRPALRFSDDDGRVAVSEGHSGAATLQVELDRRPDRNLGATATFRDGTAGKDVDFAVSDATLGFRSDATPGSNGEVTDNVAFTLTDDTANEPDETFTVTVAPDVASTPYMQRGTPTEVTVTITDDDPPAAPTGVTLRQITAGKTSDRRSFGQFAVFWDKPPGPVAEYEVQYTIERNRRTCGVGLKRLNPSLPDAQNPAEGWVTLASPGTSTSIAGPANLPGLCEYVARVKARDGQAAPGNGWGAWSAKARGNLGVSQEFGGFSAPFSLQVAPGDARLTLTWAAVPGFSKAGSSDILAATGYDVHYTLSAAVAAGAALSGDAATGWADAGHAGTGTAQTVTGLLNGREYRLRVRATNAAEGLESPWASVTGTPRSSDSSIGFRLLARNGGSGTWTEQALHARTAPDRFQASVSHRTARVRIVAEVTDGNAMLASGGAANALAPVTLVGGVARIDRDLPPGEGAAELDTYFQVTAQDGSKGDVRLVRVNRLVEPPSAPRDFSVTAGEGEAALTWTAPATGVFTGYVLAYTSAPVSEVADDAAASGSDAATNWVAVTPGRDDVSWSLTGLANGKEHRFRLRAGGVTDRDFPAVFAKATPLSSGNRLTGLKLLLSTDGGTTFTEYPFIESDPDRVSGGQFQLDYQTDRNTLFEEHSHARLVATWDAPGATVAANRRIVTHATRHDPANLMPIENGAESAAIELPFTHTSFGRHIWILVTAQNGDEREYNIFYWKALEVGFEEPTLAVAEGGGPATPKLGPFVAFDTSGTLSYAPGDTDPASIADDVGSDRPTSFKTSTSGPRFVEVPVPIADDTLNEADETFTVTLDVTTPANISPHRTRKTATVTITDDDPPAAPTGLALTPGMEKITAAWTKPAGPVTGYALRYRARTAPDAAAAPADDPGTGWVTLEPMGTATTAEITGLTMGTDYLVQVRATDGQAAQGNGYGDWSPARNAAPEGPPAAPSDLSAAARDGLSGTLDLAWTAPDGTVTRYDVHYTSSADAAPDAAVQSGEEPSAEDGWVDSGNAGTGAQAAVGGLDAGTSYFLRVRAVNERGTSAWEFGSGTARDLRRVLSFRDAAPEIAEGASGTVTAVLDKAPLRTLRGWMRFADGSATQGVDHSAAAAELDFLEGAAAEKSVSVATVQDGVNEDHETFTAKLSVRAGYEAFMRPGTPAEVTVTLLDDDPPEAPSGLAVTGGSLKLSATWTKPDGPVTGYQLRYKATSAPDKPATTAGDPATGWVTLTPSGTGTSAEIGGDVLLSNQPYVVQVRATDGQDAPDRRGNGYGDWSASVQGTPSGPPAAPGSFAAKAAHERLHVSWIKPLGPVLQYVLDYTSSVTVAGDALVLPRGSAASSGWIRSEKDGIDELNLPDTRLTLLAAPRTSWTIKGLDNGTEYRVRLRAYYLTPRIPSPWAMLRGIPEDTRIKVAFGETAHEVAESAGSGSVAAGVASPLARDALDVTVTFGGGTATSGTDYAPSGSGAFTLQRGETSLTASFTVTDDAENEAHETFTAALGLNDADLDDYGPGAAATITLLDDDPPAAPTGLSLSAGDAGLAAQWTKPGGPVTGYELRYRTQAAPDAVATKEGDPSTGWVTLTPSGTGTSAVIAGLAASIVHVVQVRATDGQAETGNGFGDWSAAVTGLPPGPPPVPTGLAAAGGHERLDLSWTAPWGTVTGYDVHYTSAMSGTVADGAAAQTGQEPDPASGWVAVGRTGTAVVQEVADLANGTPYRVRVRAVNGDGGGPWVHGMGTPQDNRPAASWDAASAAFAEGTEGAVTAVLDAAPDRNLNVTLTWVETAADGSERVLRMDPLTFTAAGGARVPVPITSEADTENDADETYAIRMSVNPATAPYLKPGTPTQVVVTIQDDDPPAAPTLTLTPGGGGLTASWTKPTGPVTAYEMRYREVGAGNDPAFGGDPSTGWVTVEPEGTATSFLVGDLTAGSEYDAQVRANDGQTAFGDGWGDWSVTVTDSPGRQAGSFAAPSALRVVHGDAALDLSWNPPPSLVADGGLEVAPTGYDVHYTSAASGTAADDADVQTGASPDPAAGWVAVLRSGFNPVQFVGDLENTTAYRVRVRATNGEQDIVGAWVTGTGTPLSGVATLSSLAVSTGSDGAFTDRGLHRDNNRAAPRSFTPAVARYRVFAIPPDELARVRVRISSATASATVNGAALTPGTWSKGIALAVGSRNTITVRVTAQDGGVKLYTVRVVRPPAAPTGLQVTAGDAQLDLSWTAPPGTVDSYDVHYTSADAATVTDGAAASGNDASAGWLAVSRTGATATQTVSDLENGERHRVRVRAVRAGASSAWTTEAGTPISSDTSLAVGSPTLKTATADGAFGAATLTAPAMPGDPFLAAATDHVRAKVAANAKDAAATVTVNGATLARDAESAAIPLGHGFTDITVQVTAPNGDTEDHVVRVPRKLVVGFTQAAITVGEGDGSAQPALDPQAPFDAAIALAYTFVDRPDSAATADLGSGYPTRVTAAQGDAVPFVFDVPIEDDDLNEESEGLRIELQQPSGSHATVDSTRNAVVITITDDDPPAAPSGLALTPGAQKLAAGWTKPAGPVTGYELQYKTAAAPDAAAPDATPDDPTTGWVTQAVSETSGTPPLVTTSADIAGLDVAEVYKVRVRATDGQAAPGNGWGDWSAATDGTPESPPPALAVTVTPGYRTLDLSWTAPAVPVTRYDVHYTSAGPDAAADDAAVQTGPEPDSGSGWVALQRTGTAAAKTMQAITGLEGDRTWRVRARAVNAHGPGAWTVISARPEDTRGVASLSAAAARIAEGGTQILAVRLDKASEQWLPVLLNSADGTAAAADYTVGTDAAQFRGDVVSQAFTVTGTDDDENEADETFSVALGIEAPHDERFRTGSPAEVEVTIADNDPPAAPTGLALRSGVSQLNASWTAPAGPVTGHELRYRTADAPDAAATTAGNPSTGWVTQAVNGTDTQAAITGLANGTEYAVQVRATDGQAAPGNGWGAWSASQAATPLAPPGAVADLVAVPGNGAATLEVRWTAAMGVVTGYDVHYTSAGAAAAPDGAAASGSDAGAGWVPWTGSCAPDGCSVSGLEENTTYRVRVRAFNDVAPGNWTHGTGTTGAPPAQAPLNLAAEAGDARIDLSWSVNLAVLRDSDSFWVEHTSAPKIGTGAVTDEDQASGADPEAAWVHANTSLDRSKHPAWSAAMTGLDNGTAYRVRVRQRNSFGHGPWAFITATPLSSDATLSALTVRTGDGVADLDVIGDDGFAAQSLDAPFDSSVTSYRTNTLPVSHDMARITATATDSGAKVEVGRKGGTLTEVTSGVEGADIALAPLTTEMTVRVLAQDHADGEPNFTDYTVVFSRPAVVGFGQSAIEIAEGATAKPTLVGASGRAVQVALDYTTVSPADLDLDTALVDRPLFPVTDMSSASPVPVEAAADDTDNEPHETFSITLNLLATSSGVVLDDDAKTVTVTITDDDPPAAPALTLTPGDSKLTATWTKPDGPVDGYEMRIRPKGGSWGSPLVLGESDTSREITKDSVGVNLTGGNAVVYEVELRATDGQTGAGNGFGDWAKASASPTGPPTMPEDLTATPGTRWLDLTWTAPPGPVTGYDVYYTTNGLKRLQDLNCYRNPAATGCASVTPFELAAPVDPSDGWVDAEHTGTDAAHRIDGLDYGSTYQLMVRAINESGTGAPALEHSTLPDTRRTVSFGADSATIREGRSATLTATLDATPGRYLAAGLTYADGTATEVLDYKAGAATVEFFKDTENLDIPVVVGSVFDTLNEADETFTVTLDVGSAYEPHLKAVAPAQVTVTITDDDPPAAPADLALKPGVSELTATWTKPDGPVTGYQLRYKTADAPDTTATTAGDPSTGWVTLAATGTGTQGTITRLTNGTEHAVQVRATDGQAAPGNGWGDWSASQAETPLAPPGAVADVVAVPGNGPGALEVRWTAATGVVTGHDVHYTSASAGAAADGAAASGSDAGAGWVAWTGTCAPNQCTVSGLDEDTTYRVRVRAFNDVAPGNWTHGTGTTGAPPAHAPSNLAAEAGDARIDLSWSATLAVLGASGTFRVEHTSAPKMGTGAVTDEDQASGADPAAGWVNAGTVLDGSKHPAWSAAMTGLDNGTAYRVRVRQTSNFGGGPWAFITATPLSSDATLSALTIETSVDGTVDAAEVTLEPAFSPDTVQLRERGLPGQFAWQDQGDVHEGRRRRHGQGGQVRHRRYA